MKKEKRYYNTNRIWSLSECSTRPITRTWPSSSKVWQNKKRKSFIFEAPEEARTVEFMKKLFKGEKGRKVEEYFFTNSPNNGRIEQPDTLYYGKEWNQTFGLYYKIFTIIIYDCKVRFSLQRT